MMKGERSNNYPLARFRPGGGSGGEEGLVEPDRVGVRIDDYSTQCPDIITHESINRVKNVTGSKFYLMEHTELTETVHGGPGL